MKHFSGLAEIKFSISNFVIKDLSSRRDFMTFTHQVICMVSSFILITKDFSFQRVVT